MDIVTNEICKLLTKRTVFILLLFVFMNLGLQLYTINTPGDGGYTLKEYSELYQKISAYNRDELLERMKEEQSMADTYGEENLYARVYREAEACITYDEYLDSIDKKADEIAVINKFADDDGYAVKNAKKTSKAYRTLKGTELKPEDPMGILNITDNALTDYIAVIMIFIIALNLVFREKNENYFHFLRTTTNGRRKLMISKIFVMILSVLVIVLALYSVNAVVSRCVYHAIDLERPIQSIYLYRSSSLHLNIGEFLACYFGVKILACVFLGFLFLFICTIFDHIIFVFVTSILTILVETICYTKIPETHFLIFLKYLNVMFGVKSEGLFSDYVNLNVMGYPINVCVLYGILWLTGTGALAFAVINYLSNSHKLRMRHTKRWFLPEFRFFRRLESHTFLFEHECYKLFISGRFFLILIVFCLFVIWWNPAEKIRFDTLDEIYDKEYMDELYGPVNDETYEHFNQEMTEYEQLNADIAADIGMGKSEEYINIKYRDQMNRQSAFDMVIKHMDYLKSQKEGWLFYEKGYDILTDSDHVENRDIAQAFVYVMMLIAVACGICGTDYQNSEIKLLRTTFHGRRKLKYVKGLLGALCMLIVFALVYMVRLFHVLAAYGTQGLNAPAACMEHLSQIPQNLSVLQYILIIMGMRLIGGWIVIKGIFVSFRYLKSSISVIISGIVIFIVPLALAAFGVPNAQYILFNSLLLGNVF